MRVGMVGKTMLLMVVVGLLPLALFGGFTLKQLTDRTRVDAEAKMQASAERISAQVDEWFDKSVRVIQATASLQAVTSMKTDEQSRVLTAVQRAYPWMYLIHTVGLDGFNVGRSDDKPLADYADREWYKNVVLRSKEMTWETVIGKTSGKPALILALPIRSGGRVAGALVAAMNIEDISLIIANWKTGKTGFAFLVDEKAKVVAHPRDEFVSSQTRLDGQPLVSAFLADGKPHLMHFNEADGRAVLGYVQGNRFHWTVAIQQDESELYEAVRQTITVGLALLAAATVLVALIALLSAKHLIRPIVEMTAAADQMSRGELDTPITYAHQDEMGRLAQSLERLRKSMKAAMERLAKRPARDG